MKVNIALAATPILYHLIDMKHAVTALQRDRLRLAPMEASKFEASLGAGAFFLSLARTKLSDYIRNNTHGNKVVFVLDGSKLGHNYKIESIDYWHDSSYNTDDEAEDRLFANKPLIPLLRYLKEVHFAGSDNWSGYNTLDIVAVCKRNGIPCFQYENPRVMVTLDKRKAIPLQLSKETRKLGSAPPGYDSPAYALEALWKAIRTVFKKHPVIENGRPSVYATLLEGAKSSKRNAARREMVDHLRYGVSATTLRNMINSAKTELAAKYANKINLYLRKNRMSVEQLSEFLSAKWK